MNPEQLPPSSMGDPYHFIMNPSKPSRPPLLGVGGHSLLVKVLLVVGGAIVLMIAAAIVTTVFLGSKTNLEDIVGLVQIENEITRVADLAEDSSDQSIKNAASNTSLTIGSQQQAWLNFLGRQGRTVPTKELQLKEDSKTDQQLTAAHESSTFDVTYAKLMRTQLEAYSALVKTTYNRTHNKTESALLNDNYDEAQLLLKQWPQ